MNVAIKACIGVAALWAVAIQADQGPIDLLEDATARIIATLKTERAELEQSPARLYEAVETIAAPHFDFTRMSRWVLGKYWRRATPRQQERFVKEFRELLIVTYAGALLDYSDQQIRFLPLRVDAKDTDVVVRTEVMQPGGPSVPIHYAMHAKDSEWKVYDVRIDGVSLVTNYRSSFSGKLRKAGPSGIDKLNDELAEHNRRAGP